MIQLKYILFYSLLSTCFFACAQSKYSITNIHAFYKVHLPGNIAVSENGIEIPSRDTVNLIYLESNSKDIQWRNAWKNGKTFIILPTVIDANSYDVGTKKATDENMVIHTTNGNKLWQLQLIASDTAIPPPVNILQNELLLDGVCQGKRDFAKG